MSDETVRPRPGLPLQLVGHLDHDSSLKRSGMARVNKKPQSYTCHPHVYLHVE